MKNKKWTDGLSNGVYTRLCECRTIKSDLAELVKCKYAYSEYSPSIIYTKEDALIYVLELLDANGIEIDMTLDEYRDLIK